MAKKEYVKPDGDYKKMKADGFARLIKAALVEAKLYKPEKDITVWLLATQFEIYQKTRESIENDGLTIENPVKAGFVTKPNPAVAMNQSCAKTIAQYLTQLGLTSVISKRAGELANGDYDETDDTDPITALTRQIENNRTPIIYKRIVGKA